MARRPLLRDAAGRSVTKYTSALGHEICRLLVEGSCGSLTSIAKMDGMPTRKVMHDWILRIPEFAHMYDIARRDQADVDADRVNEIAEGVLTGEYDAASARVAMDCYKWTSARRNPRKYSERFMLGGDPDGEPIRYEKIERVIVDATHRDGQGL